MNPMQIFMSQLFGNNQMNNAFTNNQMNFGGNNNWRCGYTAANNFQNPMVNLNQNNNIYNFNFQPQGQDLKLNFVFKTSQGMRFNLLFNYGRTVEDLIHTFFKRVDKEDLFTKGGVAFVYNATQINYHSQNKVEEFFKYNSNPTIMVLDVNNLIGA